MSRVSEAAPSVTAFAPATVANVAAGFDVLGFAVAVLGDRVTVTQTERRGEVVVDAISGIVTDLPRDPARNTATVALRALLSDCGDPCGFSVSIDKGIPLGSGLGGSAASAVGAVVAGNRLLGAPRSREDLLPFAMLGESAASGAAHADNAAPCLFGGMTAIVCPDPPRVIPIPVPDPIHAVLIHPHLKIETRAAREVLGRDVSLKDHVRQSIYLAGLIAGCFRGDLKLIGSSLQDCIIEPQRSRLIPGFKEARSAALHAGALGAGISGSGPTLFAWVAGQREAPAVARAMRDVFEVQQSLACDVWIAPLDSLGATCEPVTT